MERAPTLPGVESDDEDRVVLHVDLDCFYAACERLREPELRGEPVVVGMGYEPGEPDGAVATASYEAREHGVESAQAISTALERLPRAEPADGAASADGAEQRDACEAGSDGADSNGAGSGDADGARDGPVGYYRPVDMSYYESVAEDVKAILHGAADTVREVSIDEAYLDVTDRTDWSVAEGYGRHVKQRIEREVGLVASVGVAPTMHAAKVASDHDKPDGLVVVEPGEVESFLAPLPVDDLHGIGPVTASTLREHGIDTVADLAEADRDWIRERWGDRGLELHDRARGVDPRIVEPRGRPKSLSRESAFADPEDDADLVRERLRALAEAVADRARSKDAMYRTIGIKVVLPPYDVNTRERSLSGPVDDPDLVESVALDLLEEFEDEPPRKVGVRVSNLQFGAADQSTLGGWDGGGADDDGANADGADDVADADGAAGGSRNDGAIDDGAIGSGADAGAASDGGPGPAGEAVDVGDSSASAEAGLADSGLDSTGQPDLSDWAAADRATADASDERVADASAEQAVAGSVEQAAGGAAEQTADGSAEHAGDATSEVASESDDASEAAPEDSRSDAAPAPVVQSLPPGQTRLFEFT